MEPVTVFVIHQAVEMSGFAVGLAAVSEGQEHEFEGLHMLELDFIDVNQI